MNVNRGSNCYSCEEFGYLVQNCRRQEIIGQKERIEYEENQNTINNLNGEEDLIVLNQVSVATTDLQYLVE